jgi:hypothetical protein
VPVIPGRAPSQTRRRKVPTRWDAPE